MGGLRRDSGQKKNLECKGWANANEEEEEEQKEEKRAKGPGRKMLMKLVAR